MTTTEYHFITNWEIPGTKAEIAAIMNEPLTLPYWWPSVYLEMEAKKENGDTIYYLHTKGWLPYTIRWRFIRTVDQLPDYLELSAKGDLEGYGKWRFEQKNDKVKITYDWKVFGNKPIFKYLAFVLKPLFAFNHKWAMDKGRESLIMELERRRKGLSFQDAPNPPLATFPHRKFYRENMKKLRNTDINKQSS